MTDRDRELLARVEKEYVRQARIRNGLEEVFFHSLPNKNDDVFDASALRPEGAPITFRRHEPVYKIDWEAASRDIAAAWNNLRGTPKDGPSLFEKFYNDASKPHKCNCDTVMLMREGCKCGGV